MANELARKVAIVTGGAQGIGLATVDTFVAEGAMVVIADINAEVGAAAAAKYGPEVEFKQTDVADADQVAALVDFTVERFGGLHIMVNNAGIPTPMYGSILDDPLDKFDRVMAVDLLGVMLGTKYAAKYMAANGGGSIITTTSIGGIIAGRSQATYRAAKAGVIHFTKCAAIDLGEHLVRVNSIAPGGIPTDILGSTMTDLADAEAATLQMRQVIRSIRPLTRDGNANDIAQATVFLASDKSAYVSGMVLPVDGAIIAGNAGNNFSEIKDAQEETAGV